MFNGYNCTICSDVGAIQQVVDTPLSDGSFLNIEVMVVCECPRGDQYFHDQVKLKRLELQAEAESRSTNSPQ